jgi:hypothetical protein
MKATPEQAADLVLVSVELDRLGVFERAGIDHQQIAGIDHQRIAAFEQEAQIAILGLADLRDRKENPRHRPAGIDSPLLRDKIVQAVLFERAANPGKQMKRIVIEVGCNYGVSRSYIFRCLKEIAPERRQAMVHAIIKCRFAGEMLAHLCILAAPQP